jgi:hypothetical protein
MTVIVHQRPLEATRSSGKSCKWVAEAIVNGRTYTATSRMAPANDIARQLLADGVPDAPMHIYTAGLKGCLVWPSFYRVAGLAIRESATKPVHQARWTDPIAVKAQFSATTGAKQGGEGSGRYSGSPRSFTRFYGECCLPRRDISQTAQHSER